ncbi:MAG: HNH endonuclease signature motif containing protein, partial [Acidimicrobiales bacterium]
GRDLACRGFGCERTIRQIHHIHHWSDGGPTNLDNLVGLCWEHHRLVHEGGWNIEGNPNGEITFISPDKRRRLPSRPQPVDPRLRCRPPP